MSGEYIRHWKEEIRKFQEQRRLRKLERKSTLESSWENNPSMIAKNKEENAGEYDE